ncbi:hypothetical protein CMUS01_00555 [Colletotrichum musicola]|uniref:Uncharacterized protein n=1 Tax=Colletotrichum musicola TaxID=2175873 RepID=A0A8H6NYL3_9PEZI|nr:hypothetical protein CMUS01_00555 [Colletotrichum musicola]
MEVPADESAVFMDVFCPRGTPSLSPQAERKQKPVPGGRTIRTERAFSVYQDPTQAAIQLAEACWAEQMREEAREQRGSASNPGSALVRRR